MRAILAILLLCLLSGHALESTELRADRAYGIIPIRENEVSLEFLLIQHRAGHWGFPKGHAHKGEAPLLAANRELYEETGLRVVRYLSRDPFTESYICKRKGKLRNKTVYYYLAEVSGCIKLQQAEIQDYAWVPSEQFEDYVLFHEGRMLFDEIVYFLVSRDLI